MAAACHFCGALPRGRGLDRAQPRAHGPVVAVCTACTMFLARRFEHERFLQLAVAIARRGVEADEVQESDADSARTAFTPLP